MFDMLPSNSQVFGDLSAQMVLEESVRFAGFEGWQPSGERLTDM